MLKNEQYTGAYVSGKERNDYGTGKRYKMMESDWIVIPGKHPAIISGDVFNQVQKLVRYGTERRKNVGQRDYLFSGGLLRCGCCGYGLRYCGKAKTPIYHCVHTLSVPEAECHKMKTNVRDLDEAVLATIKKQAETVLGSIDLTGLRKTGSETRQAADCECRAKELTAQRQDCYERFFNGEIDRDTFMAMKNEYSTQIDNMYRQAALIQQIGCDKDTQKNIAALATEALTHPKSMTIRWTTTSPNKRLV